LDDPVELTTFMQSPATQKSALGLLREVSCMTKEDKNALLYNPAVATASSKIAKVPAAHTIAVGILRQEVQEAVYVDQKVVLIDGRAMEKYGRQFHKERLAVFGLGWYFRCDSSVAAARSLGLAGKEDLTTEEVLRLHAETAEIRHRNFRDQSRTVDPMREPVRAYRLDLHSYYDEAVRDELGTPYKRGRDAVAAGMVVVDTTSTQSIDEMLGPVVEVSMFALLAKGAVSHEAVGIPVRAATGL
jgi:cytidylate kinase